MHHPGHLDVGAEVLLREDFGRDVGAGNRLADNLVLFRIFRLCLARCIQRIVELAVPGELDVEIAPADQLGVRDFLGRV